VESARCSFGRVARASRIQLRPPSVTRNAGIYGWNTGLLRRNPAGKPVYINARRRRAKRESEGASGKTSKQEQMLLAECLNKSRPSLKSQSRISNNIQRPRLCPILPFSLSLSLSLCPSLTLLLPFAGSLGRFACISKHVRFRDFNWPEGIPPRGLTLRGNFRDILSRVGRKHATCCPFPVTTWASKSAGLSRRGNARETLSCLRMMYRDDVSRYPIVKPSESESC